jgi:hypothetical protein
VGFPAASFWERLPMARKKLVSNRERFDFHRFMSSAIAGERHEIERSLQRECVAVEDSMRGRGGPQARIDGGFEYVAKLKRILFWIGHGRLPEAQDEAAICKRIEIHLAAMQSAKREGK